MSQTRRGFTLLELLVVIAILAVLMGLLLSAVQHVRTSAARLHCGSQMRQLALGMQNYHDAHGAFPYAAKADDPGAFGLHAPLLPFVEQVGAHQALNESGALEPWGSAGNLQAARRSMSGVFLCPADGGLVLDEVGNPARVRARGNYRGCVGDGDPYNDPRSPSGAGMFQVRPGQRFGTVIAPAQVRLVETRDGASNTILLSEGLMARGADSSIWNGPIGDVYTSAMGGSLFSTMQPPNAIAHDRVFGPCPAKVGDGGYRAACVSLGMPTAKKSHAAGAWAAARSRHPRGVNVAMADGSVRFITDEVSARFWRTLGSRSGGESISETPPPPRGATVRILFIGNSYTFGGKIPETVQALWQSAKLGAVQIDQQVAGGATLEKHWNDGTARDKIRTGAYDYVVLQEQSLRPIVARTRMHQYARLFDEEIKKSGGRTVFFITWARSFWPETQPALTNAYQTIARELGADAVPVGPAWENARLSVPGVQLYDSDGSHASQDGSYLAACTFFTYFTGVNPEGLTTGGVASGTAAELQKIGNGMGRCWR